MRADRASLEMQATPEQVFAAFASGDTLMQWLPPRGMSGSVLAYEFRPGGLYRFALTREHGPGKTEGQRDVTHGRFLELEPPGKLVWSVVFESDRSEYAGEMLMTWSFEPRGKGTLVSVQAEHVPPGISEADHAAGLRSTLANLARFVTR